MAARAARALLRAWLSRLKQYTTTARLRVRNGSASSDHALSASAPSSHTQKMANTLSTGDSIDMALPTMPDNTATTRMLLAVEAGSKPVQASAPQAAPSMAVSTSIQRSSR